MGLIAAVGTAVTAVASSVGIAVTATALTVGFTTIAAVGAVVGVVGQVTQAKAQKPGVKEMGLIAAVGTAVTAVVEQRHGGEPRAPANRKRGEFSGKTTAMQFTETRNIRNVWTIATNPYPEAHFATFPPELAERCIKAGSRAGDTILDPFAGAFTTGLVADRLRRDAVGIELNGEYVAMAQARIKRDAGMFAEIAAD